MDVYNTRDLRARASKASRSRHPQVMKQLDFIAMRFYPAKYRDNKGIEAKRRVHFLESHQDTLPEYFHIFFFFFFQI